MNSRLEKFRNILKENNLDALLFVSSDFFRDRNIDYISRTILDNIYTSLIISLNEAKLLVSNIMMKEKENEIKIIEVKNPLDINVIKNEIKKYKRIGINKNSFPYYLGSNLKKFNFVDISKDILNIRSIKDEEEIRKIKKACSISNYVIKKIENEIKKDLSENEIAKMVESIVVEKNSSLAFCTIVASDRRSGFIHPSPPYSNKKIKRFGIIDFGVRYKGYCSDVSIPFLIGEISNYFKKIIKTVEYIHNTSIKNIKLFSQTKDLFEYANKIFIKSFGIEMQHALGHGIGLDVHEHPIISPKSEDIFKDNMIFTIEPGIYTKIGGFRIENDILIKNGKSKILTKANIIEK